VIGRLRGILISKQPPSLLVEVGGVGYEVEAPMSTIYDLPGLGKEVVLLIHHAVKEDSITLYGFLHEAERALFRNLLKVSGIGAKIALAVLSGVSTDHFARLVQAGDVVALTKIPGIGKKTAERLLLELKGKLGADLGVPGAAVASDAQADIVQALVALGYSERDAAAALKALPPDIGVSEGIKAALKALA
jgi:Holliday junction DNA helicase RuvA